MQSGANKIVGDVLVSSTDSQYIHAEAFTQIGLTDSESCKMRSGHDDNLGKSQVIKVYLHVLHLAQTIVGCKALHLSLVTHYI